MKPTRQIECVELIRTRLRNAIMANLSTVAIFINGGRLLISSSTTGTGIPG